MSTPIWACRVISVMYPGYISSIVGFESVAEMVVGGWCDLERDAIRAAGPRAHHCRDCGLERARQEGNLDNLERGVVRAAGPEAHHHRDCRLESASRRESEQPPRTRRRWPRCSPSGCRSWRPWRSVTPHVSNQQYYGNHMFIKPKSLVEFKIRI
jgi:hypothetical protein